MTQQALGSRLRAWSDVLADRLSGVDRRWLIGTSSIAIGLASWPVPAVPPAPGLDASFVAGLHMAAERGLDAGTQIVSTYGPLGFLSFPVPIYGLTSTLAIAYTAAVHFGLVGLMVGRTLAVFPWWAALPLAYVGAQSIRWLGVPEIALALAIVLALLVLERSVRGRVTPDWLLAAAGFMAAATALGKLNIGAAVVAIAVIAILAAAGRRGLAVFGAATALSVAVLWAASGQGVANLVPFLETSASITLGFTAAMGVDQDATVLWMISVAVVATAAVVGAVSPTSAAWPRRHLVAAVVIGFIAAYVTYKASFVRWHFTFILATLVIVSVAGLHPGVARRAALIATAASVIALMAATRIGIGQYLDPSPIAAMNQLRSAVSFEASAAETRATLARAYAVPDAFLERMSDGGVHIGPIETGVGFAYPQLTWAPLPVFQDYIMYTSSLDELNRSKLLGDAAPHWMLRQTPRTIDGRNSWFEGPSTVRAMFCRYSEVAVAGQWQLLEVGRDRCGTERLVGEVTLAPGEAAEVPPLVGGEAMSFVRIRGIEPGLGEQAFAFAFKAAEWYITIDGDPFRLVTPTADRGLLMAVADEIDYSAEFGFGPPHRSISVARGPNSGPASSPIVIEFWAVALDGSDASGSP